MLQHWHPVLLSGELNRRPVERTICGRDVVLFRGAGAVGALPARCPHRGMKLAEGRVRNGQLECPYHGWTFGPDGRGTCPGDPATTPRADALEVREDHGAIWLRDRGPQAVFPTFDTDGFRFLGSFRMTLPAGLELVLDNFSEAEHTPSVHWMGFDPSRLAEVEVEIDEGPDWVHVKNTGPQKLGMKLARLAVGVRPEDRYVIEWTTRFSPLHAQFDHYWLASTGERREKRLRAWIFFNPVTEHETEIVTFSWVNRGYRLERIADPFHRWYAKWDIAQDEKVLRHLDPAFQSSASSRFDRAIQANRERLGRIYRGQA